MRPRPVQFSGLVHEKMFPNLKNADAKMGSFRVLVGYGLITESYPTLFATLWTVARPVPLSMGFPRQQYWSGLPVPFPGDHPNLGIKPMSPALPGEFFTPELPGKPRIAA